MKQQNIRHLSLAGLEEYFLNIGDKKFRAKQVYDWLWVKPVQSFEAMTNLSKQLREKLQQDFEFYIWQKIDEQNSAIRLVTSWTTPEEQVENFIKSI